MSKLSLDAGQRPVELIEGEDPPEAAERPRVRIAYLTEQVSHHPPVSAYFALCASRNLEMFGIDQIAAKVSGMNVRVGPGSFNKGIFIRGTGGHAEGETYQITHPTATVNGILRGNFYVTVGDSTTITCSGAKSAKDGQQLRTVIEYKEESWLGRAHYLCEGVIHTYDPEGIAHHEWTKVKHVPRSRVVAQFHGSWKHLIKWKLASEPDSAYKPLIDLSQLQVIPKIVRPLEDQLPTESRRLWENVTKNLLTKQYGEANKYKHAIEQKQRDDAAERKKKGIKCVFMRCLVQVTILTRTKIRTKVLWRQFR
jgi:oxysterol-binding protein-related protein 9/10/11